MNCSNREELLQSIATTITDYRQGEISPIDYDFFDSLGFGAMFITYRNIANNCPLALWWGAPNSPEDHPFSKWYPLFPRKSNEEARNSGIIDKYC